MSATLTAPGVPAATARRSTAGPALIGWLAVVGAALAWGQALQPGTNLVVGPLPPFIGRFDVRPGLLLLPALAVAAALALAGPTVAARLRWRSLLLAAPLTAGVWAVTLAAADGLSRLAAPLARSSEYRSALPGLDDGPGSFLRNFVSDLPAQSVHVRGHPPGPVLVTWALERVGLAGPGWAAALAIAAGASAASAVAITVRLLAGEAAARRALPFLVLAPTALWVATSMDAVFLGVSSWGIALLAVGLRRPSAAVAGGVLLGGALFLSYGLAPLGLLALAVVVRRPRAFLLATAGVAAVVAAFTFGGFWWFDGLAATHTEWARGAGVSRSYGYFLLGDLALLAVLVGPATAAGLTALQDRRLWLLVVPVLAALALSDLAGFSRGEVERIWLPYAPWLLVAAAALPRPRRWLVAQAAVALVVQAVLVSPW